MRKKFEEVKKSAKAFNIYNNETNYSRKFNPDQRSWDMFSVVPYVFTDA